MIRKAVLWFGVLAMCAVWTVPASAQTAEEYYRRGQELMNNSRYLDAAEQFQLAIDEDDQYVDAYRQLAFVYTRMAETDEAYYQDALDVYDELEVLLPPDDVSVLQSKAFVLAAMGEIEDAIGTYEEILEVTPDNCTVYDQIGAARKYQAGIMRGEFPAGETTTPEYEEAMQFAIDAYSKSTELCPDSLGAWIELGDLYFNTDRKAEAAEVFATVWEKNPGDMTAATKLAFLYSQAAQDARNAGDAGTEAAMWQKAVPVYRALHESDPENVDTRKKLANALQKTGDYTEAATQFEQVLDEDPSVYCNLCFLYIDSNSGDKAIETAMKGIGENAPQQACLYYAWGKGLELRGSDLVREGKYDRAISTYGDAKLKFSVAKDDPNFGGPATKQIERVDQLITIAEQTREKARQGR